MQITVYGAANDVTGSCYLVEAEKARFLVDCGMFQGSEKLERLNYIPKGLKAAAIDFVILTHGHLDHCGRLPLLVKAGFNGPIYCTEPTVQIAQLVMTDSAKINEEDTERENRQRAELGQEPLEPLYDVETVERTAKLFRTVPYGKPTCFEAGGKDCGLTFTLVEAGHILGSACVELTDNASTPPREVVFSGDIGQWNVPIMEDPATIADKADLVFMESTYGERDHRSLDDTLAEFSELIKSTVAKKGKVLIPTFAVGRAQLILYLLAKLFRDKTIEPVPVFLDSPMAIAATEIYNKFVPYMDPEARLLQSSGELRQDLQTLKLCVTVDESKALNLVPGPCIIMAGAGMLNAGRILHHLRNNLAGAENLVLIVGYQPKGSLGRLMVDGAKTVKIFRETVPVRATVRGLGGFSAHAGQVDLLKWLEPMAASKPRVVLVHGESHAMDELAFLIQDKFGIAAEKPHLGDVLNI